MTSEEDLKQPDALPKNRAQSQRKLGGLKRMDTLAEEWMILSGGTDEEVLGEINFYNSKLAQPLGRR